MDDPIVEILRLAYRRGLVIRHEQEGKNNSINLEKKDQTVEKPTPNSQATKQSLQIGQPKHVGSY
jgi:hypothetical protein